MGLLEDAHARAFGANHRWISLVLGICVQLCAGSLYAVNAWGQPLKEAAGWSSDEDLSLATTAGTLGVYLAVHNGLLMDRFGARPCLVAGAATLLVGYESLAAIARDGGSPGAAALALYLVGQGSVTAFLCSLAPNVGNFARGAQGRAHGVLLAGFGGSSALFATAFRGAFRDRLSAFFRAAGWITCATCLVAALVSKDGSKTQPESAGEDAPEDARRLFFAPNSTEAVTTPTTTNVATFANARDSAPAETTTDAGDRIDGETWRALFRARLFWCVYAHLVLSLGVALLWVNQAGSPGGGDWRGRRRTRRRGNFLLARERRGAVGVRGGVRRRGASLGYAAIDVSRRRRRGYGRGRRGPRRRRRRGARGWRRRRRWGWRRGPSWRRGRRRCETRSGRNVSECTSRCSTAPSRWEVPRSTDSRRRRRRRRGKIATPRRGGIARRSPSERWRARRRGLWGSRRRGRFESDREWRSPRGYTSSERRGESGEAAKRRATRSERRAFGGDASRGVVGLVLIKSTRCTLMTRHATFARRSSSFLRISAGVRSMSSATRRCVSAWRDENCSHKSPSMTSFTGKYELLNAR